MVGAQGCSSPLPAAGMLIGFVLLGFAGVVVLTPSGSSEGAKFLPRRLQAFGYITTSRAPSSFDSSDSSSLSSSLEPSKSFESGSMASFDINVALPKIQATMGSSMGYVTISLLIQLLFAVFYNKRVVDPVIKNFNGTLDDRMMMHPDNFGEGDFQNGFITNPSKNPWVCAEGLFCPVVRIASTNAIAGVCGFWETVWCYCCCAWLTVGAGPVCLTLFWRMRLKDIMRAEQNVLTDFFGTLLCPQVSLCQMSVAVEEKMGYSTKCCDYTPHSYGAPMEPLS